LYQQQNAEFQCSSFDLGLPIVNVHNTVPPVSISYHTVHHMSIVYRKLLKKAREVFLPRSARCSGVYRPKYWAISFMRSDWRTRKGQRPSQWPQDTQSEACLSSFW